MPVAQTQLVPASELKPGEAAAIRNGILRGVLARAVSELKPYRGEDGLIIRDIRPYGDLDFSSEDWFETTGASTGYETMSSGTMADQRYTVIFGVKDDADCPSCTMLKFNVGGTDKTIWSLQALNEDDGMVGFSPAGVLIPPNTPYTISRYVRSVNSPTHITLKGIVCEPRGKVLSP